MITSFGCSLFFSKSELYSNHLNNNSNLNEKKLIQNKHEITIPLREVRNSLKLNKGDHIANADLLDLMRRVRCFGINLARLDIRQELIDMKNS